MSRSGVNLGLEIIEPSLLGFTQQPRSPPARTRTCACRFAPRVSPRLVLRCDRTPRPWPPCHRSGLEIWLGLLPSTAWSPPEPRQLNAVAPTPVSIRSTGHFEGFLRAGERAERGLHPPLSGVRGRAAHTKGRRPGI